MTQTYTARLEDWWYDYEWQVFNGDIYDDLNGRWPDSTPIHTSHCPFPGAQEGDIVQTLNSTYLLGKQAM